MKIWIAFLVAFALLSCAKDDHDLLSNQEILRQLKVDVNLVSSKRMSDFASKISRIRTCADGFESWWHVLDCDNFLEVSGSASAYLPEVICYLNIDDIDLSDKSIAAVAMYKLPPEKYKLFVLYICNLIQSKQIDEYILYVVVDMPLDTQIPILTYCKDPRIKEALIKLRSGDYVNDHIKKTLDQVLENCRD